MRKLQVTVSHKVGTKTVYATTWVFGRKFVGKAKCSPEDEFDLAVGSDIATKRVKLKALKYRCTILDEEANRLERIVEELRNNAFWDMNSWVVTSMDLKYKHKSHQ